MIAFVRGTVAATSGDTAVVDVGGVGLALLCTPATLATLRVGTSATLSTALVVREDSLTLFGFADDDERSLFETVQTVSGVGPRLAQALLAAMRPDDVRRAVATDDVTALTRVPGIGRKGAQRLVLELKDRLGAPLGASSPQGEGAGPVAGGEAGWAGQVHAGLMGLGWSAAQADAAVAAVRPVAEAQTADGAAPDVAGLLRAALRSLDRG